MTDNEYIIKVPKTPPKEELKNLQDYYILTEMRLPEGNVTYLVREVFWSAKEGVFKHSGRIRMPWQLDIPYEDVKGCLSMDNIMFELEGRIAVYGW